MSVSSKWEAIKIRWSCAREDSPASLSAENESVLRSAVSRAAMDEDKEACNWIAAKELVSGRGMTQIGQEFSQLLPCPLSRARNRRRSGVFTSGSVQSRVARAEIVPM